MSETTEETVFEKSQITWFLFEVVNSIFTLLEKNGMLSSMIGENDIFTKSEVLELVKSVRSKLDRIVKYIEDTSHEREINLDVDHKSNYCIEDVD